MSGPSELARFLGRLHPLLVHLPIGLILLLAVTELLARSHRFRQANANAGLVLALAIPGALLTAACGWLLALSGGYTGQLLAWHKWTGVAVAATAALAGLFYRVDLKRAYRLCLLANVAVLILAGHFGGSLTHGSDYLTRYAPEPFRRWLGSRPSEQGAPKDLAGKPAYTALVQPVLQEYCVSCHGPAKAKHGLRLDSFAELAKGAKSGPVIVAGRSAESKLIQVMRLPAGQDRHMPPEGKPQPSAGDLALLAWWIDAGAAPARPIAELNPPPAISRVLTSRFGGSATNGAAATIPPRPLREVAALAEGIAGGCGLACSALSPNEPWLQANAGIAGAAFGDQQLAALDPLGPNLLWLDLAGTKVTDAGLVHLAKMPNLARLHLERTAITDAGLTNLACLARLEYLDLYGTAVTDAGLAQLRKLPRLKHLYLWQTKVTPAAAAAFVDAHTDRQLLQQWQDQIDELKAKIAGAGLEVELGAPAAAASTNAMPVNTLCPVSGKPVVAGKTLLHDGKLIAFCCDDCLAQFQKDPKPYVAKFASPKPAK